MVNDIDSLTVDIAVLLADMQRQKAKEQAKKRRESELEYDQARIRRSRQDEIPVYMP